MLDKLLLLFVLSLLLFCWVDVVLLLALLFVVELFTELSVVLPVFVVVLLFVVDVVFELLSLVELELLELFPVLLELLDELLSELLVDILSYLLPDVVLLSGWSLTDNVLAPEPTTESGF